MANPSYPDVPMVPGVPAVLRNPQAAAGSLVNSATNAAIGAAQGIVGGAAAAVGNGIAAVNGAVSNIQNLTGGSFGNIGSLVTAGFGDAPTALTADDASVAQSTGSSPTWGIFDASGDPIADWDSIKAFEYKQDWRLPNYPMEQGAFQSYDKVQTPFQTRVTMTKSGQEQVLSQFLAAIAAASEGTDLFTVDAGGITYQNVSVEGYDYQRTATKGVTMLTVEISLLEIQIASSSTFTNTAQPSGADPVNGGTVQAVPITTAANTTDGQPTSALQFQAGVAATQAVGSAAASLGQNTIQAIANTMTPVVQATGAGVPLPPGIAFSLSSSLSLNPTPPFVPVASINTETGLAPSTGPFVTIAGLPINSTLLSESGETGYLADATSGLIYGATFAASGAQNQVSVNLSLAKRFQ